MDTAQWPQEIVVKPIEEIVVTNRCPRPPGGVVDHERKARPEKEQALNCPRCNSTNTKFCYYNNYSLTQPRYFCKTCRRYWTQGGSLRNIPVGGGSRKNKRSSSFFNSSSSIIIPPPPTKNIKLSIIPDDDNNDNITPSNKEGQDLNLSFPNISELLVQQNNNNTIASASSASSSSSTTTTTSHHHHNFSSALELISGITTTATTTFVPSTHDDTNIGGYTNFPLLLHHHHDLIKPSNSLNFSLDGGSAEIGFGSLIQDHTTSDGGHGGRILFPFQDLKHDSTTTTTTISDHQNNNNNNKEQQQQEDHSTGGYWTGMLGEGGSW